MSSQKPGKSKQKSLLSWIKPQDTKARVDDENVEESCAAEIPEGSSESGQDYSAVESVEAVGSQIPLLGDRPNQPRNVSFPSKPYGNRNRSFQSGWFDRHPWLHYVESIDAVFCHTCIKAVTNNLISSGNADYVFTRYGYKNWKSATEKNKGFRKHETSASHKEAVARYISTPAEVIGDVGEMLCSQHAEEKMKSRKVLLAILGNIRYLARQALPLRGNWNLETGSEENSNFYQLLKLRAEENSEILDWLRRKDDKYTSPVIQNEILEAIALCMLREISENIQNATFFTIMADETADISNKEQLVVCIRWVDENFAVHEDFIGMYPVERTTADHIVAVLKNCLISMHLSIENARGQCYDGASTMAGEKSGVAAQIKALNNKCLYTHCYGHALNLAVSDANKSVKCISDSLDTVDCTRRVIRCGSE
ncbi:zinc finger MYM-type protein 1-like [Oculina patagonica]